MFIHIVYMLKETYPFPLAPGVKTCWGLKTEAADRFMSMETEWLYLNMENPQIPIDKLQWFIMFSLIQTQIFPKCEVGVRGSRSRGVSKPRLDD